MSKTNVFAMRNVLIPKQVRNVGNTERDCFVILFLSMTLCGWIVAFVIMKTRTRMVTNFKK